jgi:hypothetical protein
MRANGEAKPTRERSSLTDGAADAKAQQWTDNVGTKPGDSGTVWFKDNTLSLDEAKAAGITGTFLKEHRPFALQWSGQGLLSPGVDKVDSV